MASSSSHAHNKNYVYDVFLSFSGEDTRKTFVDHLYDALDRHGICTFKDDEKLQKGKEIHDELLQSIQDSRCYIIVFSKRYASSSWCLNELLNIMECHKKNEQTAFPVFYDVDPSDVRKQTGSVGEALAVHKNKSESEVGKWREALKAAANLSGWDVRKTANGHEAKVIKLIVEKVSFELRPIDIDVDKDLIGMEQRMQDLDSYLELGTNDVRMIGIKGEGGAGKTTLAWAIFNKISFNFEGKSFVENVREKASQIGGLEKLQEQVLTDVLKGPINVRGVHEGRNLMSKNLSGKKVLVVLDDVDAINQLEMLAGDTTWFKAGSRIIITTRDGQVLQEHKVKWIRDANLLLEEEAIRLFSRHAFGTDIPTQGYEKYSHEVVSYAGGLPLTIKVLGSKLYGKDSSDWAYTLERLKTIHLKETLKKLELGYESLDDHHKDIFLDVACFLRGWKKEDAIRMLESCGFHAKYGLRVLEQMSLIITSKRWGYVIIDMHDHLVEMGKNIVRRDHPNEPNKHTRLWIQKEIKHVLSRNSGSEVTRCITHGNFLEGIGNMKKLRCLIVSHEHIYHDLVDKLWYFFRRFWKHNKAGQYFPNSLQYLHWKEYPHRCLPKTFEANNLVALEMPRSKIKQLWEGEKVMKKLKFLDLSNSKLRSLDLGLTPNLEWLNLEWCTEMAALYVHDGCLKSLVYLNLKFCRGLRSLDLGLTPNLEWLNLEWCTEMAALDVHGGCLKSLVYLNLDYCRGLKSVSFIEQMESLEVLHIGGLNLKKFPVDIFTWHSRNTLLELNLVHNSSYIEVPSSIGNLHKLVSLNLCGCKLKSVPGIICSLQQLRSLNLSCTGIEELQEDLGQLECLEHLNLSATKVKNLPGSICMLKHLKTLFLSHCQLLEKLPEDVGQLESLEILHLHDCSFLREIPNSICELKCLKQLELDGCKRVEKLPEELGNLKCLQYLDVRNTGITQLPQSIYSVKGLTIYKPDELL